MRPKIALVAGAAGFLGSHLCERLVKDGFSVIGIDNLYTGDLRNLSALSNDSSFRFIKHDIIEPLDLIKIDSLGYIYNLACPASPPHYQRSPLFTLDTSYLGMKNLLEFARRFGSRILQASTSEIYGDPTIHPQIETYWGNVNCFGPRSCYDEGKRVAETLMLEYSRAYGIEIKVVRIFNTYGPRMDKDDGRIISNLIVQALTGSPLTIFGDGNQTRSFCHVSDLIEGIVRMSLSDPIFTGPLNLGNPMEFSILEAANLILKKTDSDSKLEFRSLPVDDPRKRKPDINLARSILGWEPRISFSDGLDDTIAYFRGILSSGKVGC